MGTVQTEYNYSELHVSKGVDTVRPLYYSLSFGGLNERAVNEKIS